MNCQISCCIVAQQTSTINQFYAEMHMLCLLDKEWAYKKAEDGTVDGFQYEHIVPAYNQAKLTSMHLSPASKASFVLSYVFIEPLQIICMMKQWACITRCYLISCRWNMDLIFENCDICREIIQHCFYHEKTTLNEPSFTSQWKWPMMVAHLPMVFILQLTPTEFIWRINGINR